MSLRRQMNTYVDIERATESRSASGEVTNSWSTHIEHIACGIHPRQVRAPQEEQGHVHDEVFFAVLPAATDVLPGDRIKDGSTYYHVIGARDPAGKGKFKHVDLRRG